VLEAGLAKTHPGVNLNTDHVFTFEALLVAADAYKRASSADPKVPHSEGEIGWPGGCGSS
jgi:hypothetical protein